MFKIIYWSGTGNTLKMAEAIHESLEESDAKVELIEVSEASDSDIREATGVALGCPSMGAEVLSEDMEEYMESISFDNKPVVLFGSYDWGDGEWMRNWESQVKEKGGDLKTDGLILHLTPDDDGINKCKKLAKNLL